MLFEIKDKYKALKIRKAVLGNDGYCPCKPEEHGNPDILCPCVTFLSTGNCCCSLFIKAEEIKKGVLNEEDYSI